MYPRSRRSCGLISFGSIKAAKAAFIVSNFIEVGLRYILLGSFFTSAFLRVLFAAGIFAVDFWFPAYFTGMAWTGGTHSGLGGLIFRSP